MGCKKTAAILVSLSVITLQSGCATTGEGETGVAGGAIIGGALGLLNCRLRGQSGSECVNDVATGVAAGVVLGGAYGAVLEKRRANYESDVAFYDGENQKLAEENSRLERSHRSAATRVAAIKKEERAIRARVASSSEKEAAFAKTKVEAGKRLAILQKEKSKASRELEIQEDMLAAASASGSGISDPAKRKLETEIAELRSTIAKMDKTESDLASVGDISF